MALERIEQHLEVGLLRLAPSYWGMPRIGAGIAALLLEVQALEDVIWEQFDLQHIDTADRPRLLILGKLIGQTAEGLSDEALRTAIKARALANRSRGTGPNIGAVLAAIFGAGNFYWVWAGPAVIYLTALESLDTEDVHVARSVLPYSTGAGVQIQFIYSDSTVVLWGSGLWGDTGWGSEVAI